MKWVQLPGAGDVPVARSSHTITAVGDTIYLFGGEHAPRVPIGSDVHAYNLQERVWRKLQVHGTPPPLRNAHAAAAVGTELYIFGGRCGIEIGEAALNDLYKLDTTTATWSIVEPVGETRPPKRSYAAATSAGGKLYVFGGCGEGSSGRLNDLWQFDPATNRWRQLPSSDAIKGRGGPGFVSVPGALYVVAGFAGQETNDVHRFDLATETWDCPRCCSAEAPATAHAGCGHASPVVLPPRSVCAVAMHGCSSCAHANHIIASCGEVDPSNEGHAGAGMFSNDSFCMDPACGHWHKLEAGGEVPAPRGWLAATACASGLVVHGGNSLTNERLGDMYLLEMH
ncbi:nitrile-specifier 5-like [Chlorella sorokiniana]|uniref:Nitrile-specifier 5-like n=1 Tax=Chlorella sorokiniana TaxID=3076 RepID=A0A2P6TVT6_CHLSO|nr:nitrile-specifier 5-like [Chlorella sorokiniana]|eukprot:PRW58177.1 nitrile-specifier 5-like [Chlorella sorokiniana]